MRHQDVKLWEIYLWFKYIRTMMLCGGSAVWVAVDHYSLWAVSILMVIVVWAMSVL